MDSRINVNNGESTSTFAQYADTEYDVSVSDNTQTIEIGTRGRYDSWSDSEYVNPGSNYGYDVLNGGSGVSPDAGIIGPSAPPDEFRFQAALVGNDGEKWRMYVEDQDNNDVYYEAEYDKFKTTGWMTHPGDRLEYQVFNNSGTDLRVEWALELRVPVSSGYSVDGISKGGGWGVTDIEVQAVSSVGPEGVA
jgi:hypothetical protein